MIEKIEFGTSVLVHVSGEWQMMTAYENGVTAMFCNGTVEVWFSEASKQVVIDPRTRNDYITFKEDIFNE